MNEEAERQEREGPTILSFVVDDAETVERAIAKAQETRNGQTRGRALVEIARSYLKRESEGRS